MISTSNCFYCHEKTTDTCNKCKHTTVCTSCTKLHKRTNCTATKALNNPNYIIQFQADADYHIVPVHNKTGNDVICKYKMGDFTLAIIQNVIDGDDFKKLNGELYNIRACAISAILYDANNNVVNKVLYSAFLGAFIYHTMAPFKLLKTEHSPPDFLKIMDRLIKYSKK